MTESTLAIIRASARLIAKHRCLPAVLRDKTANRVVCYLLGTIKAVIGKPHSYLILFVSGPWIPHHYWQSECVCTTCWKSRGLTDTLLTQ